MLNVVSGDIRHLLKTVSGLENGEVKRKKKVKKLRFVVNDVDADVVARDVILVEMMSCLQDDDDYELLWNVWFNCHLSEHHYYRLMGFIEK